MQNLANLEQEGLFETYRILEKLGEGRSAVVYRGHLQDDPSEQVAIKVSKRPWDVAHLEARIRFEHEAQILSRLSHPNIVRLIRHGLSGDRPYVVMELMRGRTLADLLVTGSAFSPLQAAHVLRQVALALAHAHSKRIIHRDVKPSNILVSLGENGVVAKLLDFGLSSFANAQNPSEVGGTLLYMTPEQLGIDPLAPDERSDLYALGMMAVELLTGRHPFADRDAGELPHCHMALTPRLPDTLPAALREIVTILIQKEPDQRYSTASGLAKDLEAFIERFLAGEKSTFPLRTHDRKAELNTARFIGRSAEREELRSSYERALGGKTQIAFVAAKSGLGKTRLIAEVARKWSLSTIIWSSGHAYGQATAYGLVAEALGGLASQPLSEETRRRIREAVGELGAEITRLIPELSTILGEAPETVELEGQQRRKRFFAVLSAIVAAIGTKNAPLVMILDDIQWADEGSLEFLAHLAKQADTLPLLLILTYRASEEKEEEKVSRVFEQLDRHSPIHSLKLEPLSSEEIQAVAASMLGGHIPEVGQAIAAYAGGNPLFAVELVHALVESGTLARGSSSDEGWKVTDPKKLSDGSFGDNLMQTIIGRLDRLEPEQRDILALGAIAGKSFDFEVVYLAWARQSGLDLEQAARGAMAALTAASEARLIQAVGRSGEYAFSHDKIREAVHEKLEPSLKTSLHLWLAETLEASPSKSPQHIFNLARHFLKSSDATRAVRYAIQAGDLAQENHAQLEATDFYDLAQERLDRIPANEERSRLQLHIWEATADACDGAGNYQRAISTYERVLSTELDDLATARLRGKLGRTLFSKGEAKTASEELEKALCVLGEPVPRSKLGTVLRLFKELIVQIAHTYFPRNTPPCQEPKKIAIAKLYGHLLYVYYFTNGLKAIASQLRHMNFLEHHGVTSELGVAYSNHGPIVAKIPLFSRAIHYGEKAVSLQQKSGNRWGAARARHFLALSLGSAGRLREAIEHLRAAKSEFLQLGDRWELVVVSLALGFDYACQSDWDAAERYAENMIRLSAEVGRSDGYSYAVYLRGEIGSRLNLEDLLKEADETLKVSAEKGDHFGFCLTAIGKGKTLLKLGRIEDARETFLSGMRVGRKHGLRSNFLMHLYLGHADALLRRIEDAKEPLNHPNWREQMDQAWRAIRVAKLQSLGFPNHLFYLQRLRARWLWMKGKWAQAERTWVQSRDLATEKGFLYYEGLALRDHGLAIRESDPERAGNILARAWSIFNQLKARHDLELLKTHLPDHVASRAEPGDASLSRSSHIDKSASQTRSIHPGPLSRRGVSEISSQMQASSQREVDALVRVGLASMATTDPEAQARLVLDEIVSLFGAERAFLFMTPGEASPDAVDAELNPIAGRDSHKADLSELQGYSSTIVKRVWENGEAAVLGGSEEGGLSGSESAELHRLRSIIAVPLKVRDKRTGVVYLDSTLAQGLFTKEDLQILSVISNQIALAFETARTSRLENARKELAKDLEISAAVQTLFLPKQSEVATDSFSLTAFSKSAVQCGGDWWWYGVSPSGTLSIIVGDVTGHGAGPAMITASVASLFKALEHGQKIRSMPELLSQVNDILFDIAREDYFMSMAAAEIDLPAKQLRCWFAAAPPVLFLPRGQPSKVLSAAGSPVGSRKLDLGFREIPLQSGDRIVICTDGVMDTLMPGGKRLGRSRTTKLFEESRNLPCRDALSSLKKTLEELNAKATQDDDSTAVVIDIA